MIMRSLKRKIGKANDRQKLLQSSESHENHPEILSTFGFQVKIEIPYEMEIEAPSEVKIEFQDHVKIEESSVRKSKPKRSLGNNVMKNYANAMVTFALSRMAEPYLSKSPLVRAMPVQWFRQILVSKKRKVNCIKSFRELLVIDESQDSEEIKTFKGLFRAACKAFLKHFWVNWIYNSKLDDKSKYLRYRGRLLRRVENPELFTYLEAFAIKKSREQKSRSLNTIKKELKYE